MPPKPRTRISTPQQRRYAKIFYVAHIFVLALGITFIALGIFANLAEYEDLGPFKLKVTDKIVNIYYATGGSLIFASGIGFAAQYKGNKPCRWVVYCGILGILVFVEVAVGGSALGKSVNGLDSIHNYLQRQVMDRYVRDPNFHKNNETNKILPPEGHAWDAIQAKYECCGLNSYTDWQQVQFGRTSLTVPKTCCLERLRKDQYCGMNCLPVREDAKDWINTKGCLKIITRKMMLMLEIMGFYGIVVGVVQFIFVCFTSFVLMSKKM